LRSVSPAWCTRWHGRRLRTPRCTVLRTRITIQRHRVSDKGYPHRSTETPPTPLPLSAPVDSTLTNTPTAKHHDKGRRGLHLPPWCMMCSPLLRSNENESSRNKCWYFCWYAIHMQSMPPRKYSNLKREYDSLQIKLHKRGQKHPTSAHPPPTNTLTTTPLVNTLRMLSANSGKRV
jgi:hypothetical protein